MAEARGTRGKLEAVRRPLCPGRCGDPEQDSCSGRDKESAVPGLSLGDKVKGKLSSAPKCGK